MCVCIVYPVVFLCNPCRPAAGDTGTSVDKKGKTNRSVRQCTYIHFTVTYAHMYTSDRLVCVVGVYWCSVYDYTV